MKTQIFLLCCFYVTCDHCSSEFVNICPKSAQTTPVTCSADSVLRIVSSTAAYLPNLVECGSDVTTGLPENFPATCRTEQKEVFYSCHGHHTCDLYRSWIYTSVPGCLTNTQTNYLLVGYSCLAIEESTKAALPIYQDVSGPILQIFSPNFPDKMPPGRYSFSCTITPADAAAQGSFVVRLQRWFIKFKHSVVYCTEELLFTESRASTRICSDGDGYEEWNKVQDYETENTLSMTYTKKKDAYGGMFWLQMTGFKDEARIDLKITCPDQSQIPDYSPPPTTTTTTTTMPIPSSGGTSDSVSGDQSSTTITTSGSDMQQVGQEDDAEDDSSDSMLYIIIGAVAGFILIVVCIIVIVVCRYRRRKKNEQTETADKAETRQGNSMLYSDVTDPESTPETFTNLESRTKVEENIYHEEADAMYSTVKDDDVNEPSRVTSIGNGDLVGAYATVEDPPIKPGMKSADSDGAMYATVDDDDVKKPKEVANGAIGGVYADVDDSPKLNKKITHNDSDAAMYATVDEHDNKLKDKDKDEGDNGPTEMYAVVDKSKKNKDENNKGNDKSDDELDEMYATVNKGNKKEETGIMGPESEETIMCENEDIYEESEKTKEEKETTVDDNEIYDTVNAGDKKDDSGLQGPESEDTIMCENEDLYEAPGDVAKGQETEGQSKETGQKQETEGQVQETGQNHETEGQGQETEVQGQETEGQGQEMQGQGPETEGHDQETESQDQGQEVNGQRQEPEGQGQEKRKLNHGYENVKTETE